MFINKNLSTHAGRLERWLGAEQVEQLSGCMSQWYGPPIGLLDVPGGVRAVGGGDFVGGFTHGRFASALDVVEYRLRRLWREAGRANGLHTGFTSLTDLLQRALGGHKQYLNGQVYKNGPNGGAIGAVTSLWRSDPVPAAGSAGGAAPAGTALTSASTGALLFGNPSSGNLRLTGIEITSSLASTGLLLYDRLFAVAKTMSDATAEAVTGVPTRYQSTTATSESYIGGNFCFVETGSVALQASAHNWTVCQYTNQTGAGATFPSMTGNSGNVADRLDHPINLWFMPLASGDTGVGAVTQMQNSASMTGSINFVVGHPLGMITFPLAFQLLSADFVTSTNIMPKIFDDAALAFLELPRPAATAVNYVGTVYGVDAAT